MTIGLDFSSVDINQLTGPTKKWAASLSPALALMLVRMIALREAVFVDVVVEPVDAEAARVVRLAALEIRKLLGSTRATVTRGTVAGLESAMHRINDLGKFAPLGLPGFAFGVVYAFHTALCADGSTSATVLDEMITNTETTTCLAVGTTLTSGNPTLFLPTDADSLVIDPAILAELAWFDKIRDWLALVDHITPEQALGFADEEPTYAPLLRAYAARREEPVRPRKPRVK